MLFFWVYFGSINITWFFHVCLFMSCLYSQLQSFRVGFACKCFCSRDHKPVLGKNTVNKEFFFLESQIFNGCLGTNSYCCFGDLLSKSIGKISKNLSYYYPWITDLWFSQKIAELGKTSVLWRYKLVAIKLIKTYSYWHEPLVIRNSN